MCPKFYKVDGEVYCGLIRVNGLPINVLLGEVQELQPQPIAFEAATMMTVEDENGVVRSVPDKARENEGSEVVQLEAT